MARTQGRRRSSATSSPEDAARRSSFGRVNKNSFLSGPGMAPLLRAGRVGRPHGLDGSFHVLQGVAGLLTLGADVVVGDRERRISRLAGTATRAIVRLEGCEDRASAEALKGAEILVPRHDAPDLEPDEWWAEDLEGCAVHDGGRRVGVVRRLVQLPSCEVLEVEREGGAAELLVPLVTDAVRNVDIQGGQIEIDLRFLGLADE